MKVLPTAYRGVRESRRARAGALLLGTMVILSIFAEVLAGDAPILVASRGRLEFLPALVHPGRYRGLDDDGIARLHAGERVVWALLRAGPREAVRAGPLAPPSSRHPLGTDAAGRDVAARLLYGARATLGVALGAVALSVIMGALLGGLAGYKGGFWNDRLVRVIETASTYPAVLVIALVRAAEREPSFASLAVVIALVRWAEVARLVRAEVLRAHVEDYVLAARALGASPVGVFWRHIAPHAVGPALISAVFGIAAVVPLETTLSFLGLGAPAQAPSWGGMLAQAAEHPSRLHLSIAPSLAVLATVLGAYLLGDSVRDALDPHTLRRRT